MAMLGGAGFCADRAGNVPQGLKGRLRHQATVVFLSRYTEKMHAEVI
jgi:hypothetical protein